MTSHARRRRSYRRPPPILFIIIGLIGLVIGLIYAWFINPVQYVDVKPAQLDREQQRTYLIMVSLAYASDGDLERARVRLGALGLGDDVGQRLADTADEAVTLGLADRSVKALTNLAMAFGGQPGEVAMAFAGTLLPPPVQQPAVPQITPIVPTATPLTPTLPTSTPTFPPDQPTLTLTPTPLPSRYVLVDGGTVCDAGQTPGLLEVIVQDEDGVEVPGVEVRVEWEEGQDSFFTGLKPEESPGYADFQMTEGVAYQLRVIDEDGDPASELSGEISTSQCLPGAGEDPQLDGYELVFREQ